jgi:predicted AlkP superfamily pyrophosphatase or phosphodiesterase
MLPAAYSTPSSLADVLSSSLAAVTGTPNPLNLAQVERAVVVLVDGLGSHVLRSRAGHARHLAPKLSKTSIIDSGFPTTTAAALASLCTGTTPGEHGLVGYRVRDVANDRVVNQLSGWDDGMVPEAWQRSQTVFERARAKGIPTYAIGQPRYSDSGFTHAVLRGATYVSGQRLAQRFSEARRILELGGTSLTYLYVHELDVASHAKGSESDAWLAELEQLDSEFANFASSLKPGDGVVLTADHGVLDVPESAHILFDTVPALIDGVELIGGEPRCLQLYLEPDARPAAREGLAAAWRRVEGERAWIATREEAVAAGWFGRTVDPVVIPRIGDVIVAARKRIAYYDSRETGNNGRTMIGQHGSITAEETRVPLLRFGDFAESR